jgi:hypothetical protein
MMPTPLVLRLYLDEDVDVLLAELLAARGFDCLTTVSAGHIGWSDEAHLDFALCESRILISHNRQHFEQFEQLAVRWWGQQKEHAGIVLAIRRANTYELARHVLSVLAHYNQSGWRNCVMYA